jgi:hypothetical protein
MFAEDPTEFNRMGMLKLYTRKKEGFRIKLFTVFAGGMKD